jgi:recombination protein RecA
MAKAKPAKAVHHAKSDSDDSKMLENALGQIEKAFGRGSIMKLSEAGNMTVSGISTGAFSIDLALGGMGFPRGRIIECFGPESSGKTTLPAPSAKAGSPRSSMPNMLSIHCGPSAWA